MPQVARPARRARVGIALLAALAAVAAPLVAPGAPAQASLPAQRSWIGGVDQYATSAMLSRELPASDIVYLVSGESGGDALAVPPAAAMAEAHVLLVRRDAVPAPVAQRLRELRPGTVHVVGNRGVLTDALWRGVRTILPTATISRVGTNDGDRVTSAIGLAKDVLRENGVLQDVFVVGRNGYSDGLAAGNVAARIGGAVLPAIGDPAAWAQRVLPTIRGVRAVHLVGGPSVLPQAYADALADVLPEGVAMDRLAGADRFATNALLVDAFVPGISADRVYLIAGSGHGDSVGASVLAARQDASLLLSGRTCHEHEAVPEQIDRLSPERVVGVGTRHWITADALGLRLCSGWTYETQHASDPAMAQLQPAAAPVPTARIQHWAGQRFGTFRAGTASGGAGTTEVQLPPGIQWGVLRMTHEGTGSGSPQLEVTLHSVGASATDTLVTTSRRSFAGSALIAPLALQYAATSIVVTATGPWTVEVHDLRGAPLLASQGTSGAVGLWRGADLGSSIWNGADPLQVRTAPFWHGAHGRVDVPARGDTYASFGGSPAVVWFRASADWSWYLSR